MHEQNHELTLTLITLSVIFGALAIAEILTRLFGA